MKIYKHFLLLLAVIALIGALLLPAAAQQIANGSCGTDVTWSLDDSGKLTISGTGAMTNFASGAAPWAAYKATITSVFIENGVTSIGAYSFQDCTALVSVSIANTVTVIGDVAFSGCSSLNSITTGDNFPAPPTTAPAPTVPPTTAPAPTVPPTTAPAPTVPPTTTGGQVPALTAEVKNLLPAGLTSIGKAAFGGCSSLENIEIPSGITAIDVSTFRGCTALKEITIPATVTAIGDGAFAGCTSLKTVTYSGDGTQWAAIVTGTDNAELTRAYTQTVCAHTWDTGAVTLEPNCTYEGVTTFTCTICNGTKEEPIEKDPTVHVFTGEKVDANNHKLVCTHCKHEETAKHNWDAGVETTEATCAKKGVTTFTCADCGGTKTKDIAKLNTHTYDNACDISCNVCGLLRRTVHEYPDQYETNATHHWQICTICQHKKQVAHVWNKDNACKTCGMANPNPHEHSFSTGWFSDDTQHWHICICEEKSEVGDHTWNSDDICSVCGTDNPTPPTLPPTEPPTIPPTEPPTAPAPAPTEPVSNPAPEFDFPIWILVVLLVLSAGGFVAFVIILKKFG